MDSATVPLHISIESGGVADFDRGAPLEDRVDFLLRRNVESQKETNALARRLTALEEATPGQLAELRGELEAHVARELELGREDYRLARQVGASVLIVGVFLTTTAGLL